MAVIVYGLVDPTTRELRYVGQTIRSAQVRSLRHMSDAKHSAIPHVKAWIRCLAKKGFQPEIWVLESHTNQSELDEGEQHWIAVFACHRMQVNKQM